jgi:hypothetical protein
MDPYTKQSPSGAGGYSPAPAQQLKRRRRRSLRTRFRTERRVRYLACAAIVIVGAVSVPTVGYLLAKPQPQVLKATHTLPAGHLISPGDLTAVTGRPQGTSVIPAGQQTALVGHQLKLEVPAGALVAPGDFGVFPPIGMTLVPVAVKPGQYPPTLTGGDQVAIFPAPGASDGATAQTSAHAAATARVIQLQPAASDSTGTVVVLLETSTAQAPTIAQAPGVVLVTLDAQGDAP